MREKRATIRAVLLLLAGAALIAGCGGGSEVGEVEFRVPVAAREVGTGTVEELVVATGTLRAAEVASIEVETRGELLIGRTGGRRLAEGDRVDAGQVIAEVRGKDTELAARMEANQQRFDSAEKVLAARRRLYAEGLVSEEQLEDAETRLVEARLELDRSHLTDDRTRLASPIAGVILRLGRGADGMPVSDGQLVSPGFVIAQIAPLASLVADIDLVGPDVAKVRPGLPARVQHYAWEDEVIDGRLLRLSPTLDAVTRTVRAEVVVDNSAGLLRPGMFVEVTLVIERREDVPVVPREAVTERGGQRVVFVLDGQRVAQREVRLGLGNDLEIEVLQGIEPGERIVVRGLETLTDETRVRVTG